MDEKPKRRWFRYSLMSLLLVITLFAVVLGWILDHNRQSQLVFHAQQQLAANTFVTRHLHDVTDIQFVEAPLQMVMEYIEDLHNLHVVWDNAAINASPEPPDGITIKYNGHLNDALHQLLQPRGLTYFVKDGNLLITTPMAVVKGTAQESSTGSPAFDRTSRLADPD